ncbi:thermonuclease family protein [Enterococcus avium]
MVYVWADGKLVQETLANEGLGMVRSTKSKNTKYQDKIKKAEQQAKERKQNIWSIENYAQADKGYNQAAVTAHLKALEEEIAAKKAEAERQKKEQEAKEAEEKRAAEQAEAAKKPKKSASPKKRRRLNRPKNNASLKKQRRKLKQRKLHVLSKRPRLSRC